MSGTGSNQAENQADKPTWKLGKRDALFFGVVAAVILLLVLGTSERKTKPAPNDEAHRTATARAACMACHGVDGIKPQPMGHTKSEQCFQCHMQPEGWQGKMK